MNERRFLVAGAALAAVGLSSLALTTVLADENPVATEVVASSTTEAPATTPAPTPPPETAPPPTEPPATAPSVSVPDAVPATSVQPDGSTESTVESEAAPTSTGSAPATPDPGTSGGPIAPPSCVPSYAVTFEGGGGLDIAAGLWFQQCELSVPLEPIEGQPVVLVTDGTRTEPLCNVFGRFDSFTVWRLSADAAPVKEEC